MLIDKGEFSSRFLEASILNYSGSDKVNFSLEYNLHIRFTCILLLEYLVIDCISNK